VICIFFKLLAYFCSFCDSKYCKTFHSIATHFSQIVLEYKSLKVAGKNCQTHFAALLLLFKFALKGLDLSDISASQTKTETILF